MKVMERRKGNSWGVLKQHLLSPPGSDSKFLKHKPIVHRLATNSRDSPVCTCLGIILQSSI